MFRTAFISRIRPNHQYVDGGNLILWFGLSLFLTVPLSAAEEATATPTQPTESNEIANPSPVQSPPLVYQTDFQTDCRNDFQITGGVAWQPGKLVLQPGATVRQNVNGNWQANWRFQLQMAPSTDDRVAECSLQIIAKNEVPLWQVRWQVTPQGNGELLIKSLAAPSSESSSSEAIEKKVSFAQFAGLWQIDYSVGLVQVFYQDRLLVSAYYGLDESDIAAGQWQIGAVPLHIQSWQQSSFRPLELTSAQSEKLLEINLIDQQIGEKFQNGDYTAVEALGQQLHSRCLTIFGSKHPRTLAALNTLAIAYENNGKFQEAAAIMQQTLALTIDIFDASHPQVATTYNNLGLIYESLGRYAESEQCHRQALTILETNLGKNHLETAQTYNNLGLLYFLQGRYLEAEPLFRNSLQIRQQQLGPTHELTAQSFNNLALWYRAQSKLAEAECLYQQALSGFSSTLGPEHPETINCLNNLAFAYQRQGKLAAAETIYRRCLANLEAKWGTDHFKLTPLLNNLASLLDEQEKWDESELLYQRTLQITKNALGPQHPRYAISLNNLAQTYTYQKKFQEAGSLQAQVLAIFEQQLGKTHPLTGICLHNLGRLNISLKNYAEAHSLFTKAYVILETALGSSHLETIDSLANLGYCYYLQKNWPEAEPFLRQAIASSEANRPLRDHRELFRSLISLEFEPYSILTQLYLETQQPTKAWQVWETFQGRGLFDGLAALQASRLSPTDRQEQQALLQRCQSLQRLLTQKNPKNDNGIQQKQWQQELQDSLAILAQRQRQFAEHIGLHAAQSYTLAQVQAQLLPNQAILGWFDFQQHHFGYVVRSQGEPIWVNLTEQNTWSDENEKIVEQIVNQLAATTDQFDELDQLTPLIQKISQQHIEPLLSYLQATSELPQANHWIVIPTPSLRALPIELLAPENVYISYCASSTIFAWLNEQRQHRPITNNGFLALGDPNFNIGLIKADSEIEPKQANLAQAVSDKSNPNKTGRSPIALGDERTEFAQLRWVPLPDSRREVLTIVNLALRHDLQVTSLLGSDASEQQLWQLTQTQALKRFRYLHFATHGLANERYPLQSKLILARDQLPEAVSQLQKGEPVFHGELTAEMILNHWQLDADLVALSACQSGLGQFVKAEGYLGLTQPLLLAGARSVVVSLWNVSDTATALLMSRFYENLWSLRAGLNQPMNKVAALHEAKQWLRTLNTTAIEQQLQTRGLQLQKTLARKKDDMTNSAEQPFAHPCYWAPFILIGDWQ